MSAITSTSPASPHRISQVTDPALPAEAEAVDATGVSAFETPQKGALKLSAEAGSAVASTTGETFRVSGGALVATASGTAAGAELANDTVNFMEAHVLSPEYQKLTWTHDGAPDQQLAKDVRSDALSYIANTPGLSAECDKMIAATGAHPAKVEGLKVDFALNHFESVGEAAGLKWGKTEAAVKEMLAAELTPTVYQRDTEGKSKLTVAGAVSGATRTFVNIDGNNNKVDFCTNPYPRASGSADVVLGGQNNSGQVDLVGTVVIKAGQDNVWTVKDPSTRSTGTALAELNGKALAANAKECKVVLEGNSADWSVLTSGTTATYTNQKTKTSVTIPASAQGQVSYSPTQELGQLAAQLKAGTAQTKPPPQTTTTQTTGGGQTSGAGETGPTGGSGPSGPAPTTQTAPTTGPATPAALSPALEAVFASMPEAVSALALKFMLEKLGISVTKGESLASMKQKLAEAMRKPGGPTVAQLKKVVVDEAKSLFAEAKKSSETKDPIDWYLAKTGKNKEAELARWAAEGKSPARVREELGTWQKKETIKVAVSALLLASLSQGLDNAEAAGGLTTAVAAHTDSISTAPAGSDGKWTRPLDTQPLEVPRSSTIVTAQTPFQAGRDASLRRISERALEIGLGQQQYNMLMRRAAGELNHRTTVDMRGNDPKLPEGYTFPTPEIDAELNSINESKIKWGAGGNAHTDPVLHKYDSYAKIQYDLG